MRNSVAICMSVAALAVASSSLAPVLAQSGSYDRSDRDRSMRDSGPTINQLVDQADSRIARLKADLRLTPEQADKWGDLQKVLHDRAQRSADSWIKLREEIADQRQRARDERRRDRDDREARAQDRRDDRDARAQDRNPPPPAPDASAPPPPASTAGNRPVITENKPAADMRADAPRVDPARADPDDDIAAMRRQADAMTNSASDLRKIADASEPLYKLLDAGQRQTLIRFISAGEREQGDEQRRGYRRR